MPEMIVVGLPGLQNGYVPTPYEERKGGADGGLRLYRQQPLVSE